MNTTKNKQQYDEELKLKNKIKQVSIDSDKYKKFRRVYEYALKMTERETYQAVEGLYHNLNTLQSMAA